MSKTTVWLLLAAIAAGGALYTRFTNQNHDSGRSQVAVGPELIRQGGELFTQYCLACHGPGGQGQIPQQSRGGFTDAGEFIAPALNGNGHTWHHPPDALFRTVKQGSLDPKSPMKEMGSKLSDPQIHAVLAYIKSLWPSELRERYERSHQ